MNAKPTALDAYLARTVAIHAKLERLRQVADDHFFTTPMPSIGATSATSGGWRPGWTNCWRFSMATANDDAHQPPEMIMNVKLTATQAIVLKAAANRPDGNIAPLPSNLRGGARAKVIEGLLARGLIAESEGSYLLTDDGYAAVGGRRPVPKGVQEMDTLDALTKREPIDVLQKLETTPPTIRAGTKLAAIMDAMRHPGGASITQMMADTGWQAHTVRGAISGMVRKRLGYQVVSEKGADGQRAYRIA